MTTSSTTADTVFWVRVNSSLADIADDCDQDDLDLLQFPPSPCPVCGSRDACGFDVEGRALIHAERADEP